MKRIQVIKEKGTEFVHIFPLGTTATRREMKAMHRLAVRALKKKRLLEYRG